MSTFINPKQRIDIFCRSNLEYFGDRGKCIRGHDAGNEHPRIGIELKTGDYEDHMTGTVYSFRKRLMEDIEKIQTRSPEWTNTCGARVFAVGVTGSDGDLCGYEAVLKPGYMRVQYTKTPSRFFVAWWYKDFLRIG